MRLSNARVGMKLGLGFGLVIALLLLISGVGIWNMSLASDRMDRVINNNVHKMELVHDMSDAVHIGSRLIRDAILSNEPATMQAEMAKAAEAQVRYRKAASALEALGIGGTEQTLLKKIKSSMVIALPINDKVVGLAQNNNTSEAFDLLINHAGPATLTWQNALDETIALQKENNRLDAAEATHSFHIGWILTLSLSVVTVLIGLFAAILITRDLSNQLGGEPGYAAEIATRIAYGNLVGEIRTKASDNASMLHAIKVMRDKLAGIVSQVRSGTDTISTASNEIASGNLDLSARTEEQARSLEETTSSLENLTSAVKQNAEYAGQANQLAIDASAVAVRGGQLIVKVSNTMGSIDDSAKRIADITSVINGIAFQTNILALNAAVEAARAGEQGRGFAVVASEVRNLAQRSAAAAKEIKGLIGDSIERVHAGGKLVNEAGTTMREIVASVGRVTDVIAEIADASQEQSSELARIHHAISLVDQATQQNAALVEQAAAASESLQEQASNLAQLVSVFRLDGIHDGPASVGGAISDAMPSQVPTMERVRVELGYTPGWVATIVRNGR
jgi:methyl-accepting chemotaxis protein